MTLRRAGPADAAALSRLNVHVQGWHAARYPEAFVPAPDPEALLAWFALGYALCTLQTREASVFSPAVRRLMIDHIAVVPEARRKGHGRALLRASRELARDLGADEILLDTWEANHDAHAFFRAEGFSPRRMLFRATP